MVNNYWLSPGGVRYWHWKERVTLMWVDASKQRCLEDGHCLQHLLVLLPLEHLVGCPGSSAKMWLPMNSSCRHSIFNLELYFSEFDFYLQLPECLIKAVTGVQISSAAAQLFQVVGAAPAKNSFRLWQRSRSQWFWFW